MRNSNFMLLRQQYTAVVSSERRCAAGNAKHAMHAVPTTVLSLAWQWPSSSCMAGMPWLGLAPLVFTECLQQTAARNDTFPKDSKGIVRRVVRAYKGLGMRKGDYDLHVAICLADPVAARSFRNLGPPDHGQAPKTQPRHPQEGEGGRLRTWASGARNGVESGIPRIPRPGHSRSDFSNQLPLRAISHSALSV